MNTTDIAQVLRETASASPPALLRQVAQEYQQAARRLALLVEQSIPAVCAELEASATALEAAPSSVRSERARLSAALTDGPLTALLATAEALPAPLNLVWLCLDHHGARLAAQYNAEAGRRETEAERAQRAADFAAEEAFEGALNERARRGEPVDFAAERARRRQAAEQQQAAQRGDVSQVGPGRP